MTTTGIDYKTDTTTTTKLMPHYNVIVYNDDEHSFPFVVEIFNKVLRYDIDKCTRLAWDVHRNGRSIVWTGTLEVAELKKEQLANCGKDPYGDLKIDAPLVVTIEISV